VGRGGVGEEADCGVRWGAGRWCGRWKKGRGEVGEGDRSVEESTHLLEERQNKKLDGGLRRIKIQMMRVMTLR
jgi:hypothetical protein